MTAGSRDAAPAAGFRPARGRRPAATSADTAAVLARLADSPAAELRSIWCAERGTAPPATFTARLLRLALAWDAQQREQGGRVSTRGWDQIIRRRAAGAGRPKPSAVSSRPRRLRVPG
jgi:hypothetical protein